MENKEQKMSVREKKKGLFPRRRSKLKPIISPLARFGRKIVGDDIRVFWSRVIFLLGPLVALFQVELLNETNRDQVTGDILTWIDGHLPEL